MVLACVLLWGAGVSRGQWIEDSIWVPGACLDIVYNPVSNKAYVALTTDQLAVIDGATNQVLNTISVPEPVALALNTNLNKVYCTSGERDRLTVIDGVADTVVKVVSTPGWPHRMAYSAALNKLYVACTDVGVVRVLDGTRDSLVGAVGVGPSGPEYLLWHPHSNRLFCSLHFEALVVVVDCLRDEVVHTRRGQGPYASCWNRVNDFVYLLTEDTILAFAPAGDSVVAKIPANISYYGYGACFVPCQNEVFASGMRLYVVDCNLHVVTDSLSGGGSQLLFDSIAGKVYALPWGGGTRVIDARSKVVVARFGMPYPKAMAWCWPQRRVYVADWYGRVYSIRDTSAAVAEPGEPAPERTRPAASARGSRVFVWGGGRATLLDISGRGLARLESGANDVRHVAPGVYFVRVDDDGRTAKIVIGR